MKANHFNIGFVSFQLIYDSKRKDGVSSSDILIFRRDINEFVIYYKLLLIRSLNVVPAIISNGNLFDPTKMISKPSENVHIKFRDLLRRMSNLKILTSSCDKNIFCPSEFKYFLRNHEKKYNDNFAKYCSKK